MKGLRLAGLAMVFAAAFLFGPPVVAALWSGADFTGERGLTEATRVALDRFWTSGSRELPPELERIVDYWFAFHVVKAVAAAALLVVLGVAVFRIGRRVAAIPVAALGLVALAALLANIQGAVAPLAALLPLAADGAPGVPTWEPARQQLAEGRITPALDVMIGDYALFHAAMVVLAGVVAVALVGASVALGRRFAGNGSPDTRLGLGTLGALSVVLAMVFGMVAAANATTVTDPAPGLLAFFDGGW